MSYWVKEFITKMFDFSQLFSRTMYETIYSFVDRLFSEQHPTSDIHTREDIFKGTDDEDKKEMITAIIMLVILIAMLVLIIKADIYVTKWKIAQMEADFTYFIARRTGGFLVRSIRGMVIFIYRIIELWGEFIALLH